LPVQDAAARPTAHTTRLDLIDDVFMALSHPAQ
jgi:hypothetical protein